MTNSFSGPVPTDKWVDVIIDGIPMEINITGESCDPPRGPENDPERQVMITVRLKSSDDSEAIAEEIDFGSAVTISGYDEEVASNSPKPIRRK